jgi:hypothetical protein
LPPSTWDDTFQMAYSLDAGSWTWTGHRFTNDWTGTGSGTFTLRHLSAGNHQVALHINTVPGPGSTYVMDGPLYR